MLLTLFPVRRAGQDGATDGCLWMAKAVNSQPLTLGSAAHSNDVIQMKAVV